MNEKYYYYKLTTDDDNTIFNNPLYCEINVPAMEEKIPELTGLDKYGYTAKRITKEEYEMEAEQK